MASVLLLSEYVNEINLMVNGLSFIVGKGHIIVPAPPCTGVQSRVFGETQV